MALSYELCCKLFDKNFENLNYTNEELFFIREYYSECSKVMNMLDEDLAIKLYRDYNDFICDNCSSNISDFFTNELLVAIRTIVAECIFQAAYTINIKIHKWRNGK
ncbi:hypothetical protein I4L44_001821 [Campylobacter jejuni]|nr:hypothetical protein [Campylobacter jejuni]